jgi:valyl-tRNA synthetase
MAGEIPFRHVIIHTTVLAADGRRMSKSLGTGLNPLDLIDEHGADATRYGLLKMSSSQDVRFAIGAIEEGRKLANKLWNASRLLLGAGAAEGEPSPETVEERWIYARLDETRREIDADLESFDFAHAVDRLYHVTFDDFCDWYLEAIKPRLDEAQVRATAVAALERLLKLLHPVLPHVTEEIWSQLPDRETRLIVSAWPEPDDRFAADLHALDRVQEARPVYVRSGVKPQFAGDGERIFEIVTKRDRVQGEGNADAEVERLRKEIARAEGMLANERFTSKAPSEVVAAEREKLERYRRELDAISN